LIFNGYVGGGGEHVLEFDDAEGEGREGGRE